MEPEPLTSLGPHGTIPSGEDLDMTADHNYYDISDVPNRVVLTGTFTAHRSVLSASEFSLYTEVTIHVDQVFEDQTGSGRPAANHDITVIVYGGTVLLASGERLSISTEPVEYFLQPGRKYLLELSYSSKGDFYDYYDSWDLSDGTARPNTHRTQYVARCGLSLLNGASIWQIGDIVGTELYPANRPLVPQCN